MLNLNFSPVGSVVLGSLAAVLTIGGNLVAPALATPTTTIDNTVNGTTGNLSPNGNVDPRNGNGTGDCQTSPLTAGQSAAQNGAYNSHPHAGSSADGNTASAKNPSGAIGLCKSPITVNPTTTSKAQGGSANVGDTSSNSTSGVHGSGNSKNSNTANGGAGGKGGSSDASSTSVSGSNSGGNSQVAGSNTATNGNTATGGANTSVNTGGNRTDVDARSVQFGSTVFAPTLNAGQCGVTRKRVNGALEDTVIVGGQVRQRARSLQIAASANPLAFQFGTAKADADGIDSATCGNVVTTGISILESQQSDGFFLLDGQAAARAAAAQQQGIVNVINLNGGKTAPVQVKTGGQN